MLKKIRDTLRGKSDSKLLKKQYSFFQSVPGGYGEGDHFLGINNPNIRLVAREYFSRVDFKIITDLLHSKYHEERLLALIMMERQFNKASQKTSFDLQRQKELYQLYLAEIDVINNWDLVDLTAPHIPGRYLLDKKDRSILYQLARSGKLWHERIAILSSHAFIRKGFFTDALKLSEILLHHPHDLIHKAVGWSLREIGKRDLNTELEFLHINSYQSMPRTALRYAIERFPEPLRQRYLKGLA